MAKLYSFEDSTAWKDAHKAVLQIYFIVRRFPKNELYGIVSQLCRAAVSVPANIAEGFYRNTTKELINFLYIARGSCGEVIYYLILAKDLGYLTEIDYQKLRQTYDAVAKQLNGWIRSLKNK